MNKKNKTPYPSSEYSLLESLKPFLNYKKSRRYPIAIGDDAAIRVCKNNEELILTADSFVQDVHFSFSWMTPQEIGYKAMAINLSDCASMAAVPDGALVQIIFPKSEVKAGVEKTLKQIYEGFYKACTQWNFPIIGGNLSGGPCWILDITLFGRKQGKGRLLTRKGLQNGDNVWVTGSVGESSAGLACLQKWKTRKIVPKGFAGLVDKHVVPIPRIEVGTMLGRNSCVHTMIDISDGVSKECHTLAYDNTLGIILDNLDECLSASLRKCGTLLKKDPLQWVLSGGEDYELLFTASARFDPAKIESQTGVRLTRIGIVSNKVTGVLLKSKQGKRTPLKKSGWDHMPQKRL